MTPFPDTRRTSADSGAVFQSGVSSQQHVMFPSKLNAMCGGQREPNGVPKGAKGVPWRRPNGALDGAKAAPWRPRGISREVQWRPWESQSIYIHTKTPSQPHDAAGWYLDMFPRPRNLSLSQRPDLYFICSLHCVKSGK